MASHETPNDKTSQLLDGGSFVISDGTTDGGQFTDNLTDTLDGGKF